MLGGVPREEEEPSGFRERDSCAMRMQTGGGMRLEGVSRKGEEEPSGFRE